MPVKRNRKTFGDLSDPEGMAAYRERFLESMGIANYSQASINNWGRCIDYFIAWCEERGSPNRKTLPNR